jgi:hypothetical protein
MKAEGKPDKSASPFPRFVEEEPIQLLSIADAIRFLNLRHIPLEVTDKQLAMILRKTELGPVDRENYDTITAQFGQVHDATLFIGIETYR